MTAIKAAVVLILLIVAVSAVNSLAADFMAGLDLFKTLSI